MHSVLGFFLVAVAVTMTPGPATAMIMRVAARDGRKAAMSAIAGNSVGVLTWGILSALGVSSLIVASQLAYDGLRIIGAVVLVVLGARSLLRRCNAEFPEDRSKPRARTGWRSGLVTSMANPKLAVFFVALFPQFIARDAAVLPYALAMAGAIVVLDILWYSGLACALERARTIVRPRVRRGIERCTGAVMIGLGVRLVAQAR